MNKHEKYERWCREIRDPAKQNSEGVRRIEFSHNDYFEYQIAEVPGGWAYTCDARLPLSGRAVPWFGPLPTREAALERVLYHGNTFFNLDSQDITEAKEFLTQRLQPNGLFGFLEPDLIKRSFSV